MVKRSTLAVSLVVVLVLLSGCSTVLDGGNGAGTETPVSAEEFDYADGFGPNGITDGQQAVESYQSALKARGSYTGTYSYDVQASGGNSTVDVENRVDFESQIDFESQQGYQRFDVDSPMYSGWIESYYEDDMQYRRSEVGGERSNVSVDEQNFTTAELTSTDPIRPLLSNVSSYEVSIEQRDGTTVAVYERSGTEGIDSFYNVDESADISSFSATFAVDSEGVIHSASYDITYTTEGEEQTVTVEFELSDLGETSVERPDWADEAR